MDRKDSLNLENFDFSTIKALCFDLDGTLLTPEHTLSKRTIKAIEMAKERGIAIFLASGRSFDSMTQYHKQLSLTTPIICSNGTLVLDPSTKKLLSSNYLSPAVVKSALDYAEKEGHNLFFYWEGVPHYTGSKAIADEYYRKSGASPIFSNLHEIDTEHCTNGAFLISKDEKTNDKLTSLEKRLNCNPLWQKTTSVFLSSYETLGFTSQNASKGKALERVLQQIGLTLDEVVTFGDGLNDKQMLEMAKIGVAMGNALPLVKAFTPYSTLSNGEDGVAHFLERYFF